MADSAALELVRRAFVAFATGDVEAVLPFTHEEVVFVPLAAEVTGEPFVGHSGLRAWAADRAMIWDLEIQTTGFQQVAGRVLVSGRMRARGHGGGVQLDIPAWWVIEMRDGRIGRIDTFADEPAARAAAAG